jgi:hypothetical protein
MLRHSANAPQFRFSASADKWKSPQMGPIFVGPAESKTMVSDAVENKKTDP